MAGNLIKAFLGDGSGGFTEVETEVYTSEDKAAILAINKQLASIDTKTASFDLVLADAGAYIRSTSATAITCTVPLSSQQNIPVNTIITIRQAGAGQVSITFAIGVSLNGDVKTAGQHKSLQLIKVGNDTWDIVGGVV